MENILSGNPLLNLTGPSQPQANFKVKRRYCTVNKLEISCICIQYRLYIKLYVQFFFYCIKLYGGSTLFGADRNVWRLKHVLMCRSHLTQPCSASHISLHCTSDDLQPFSKMPMFFADFPRTVSSDMHTSTHKHTLYRFSFDNMFVGTHILHI